METVKKAGSLQAKSRTENSYLLRQLPANFPVGGLLNKLVNLVQEVYQPAVSLHSPLHTGLIRSF